MDTTKSTPTTSTASVSTSAATEVQARTKAGELLAAYFGTDSFTITNLNATAITTVGGDVIAWQIEAEGRLDR